MVASATQVKQFDCLSPRLRPHRACHRYRGRWRGAVRGASIALDTQRVSTQLQTILSILRDRPEITQFLRHMACDRVLQRPTLKDNISALETLDSQVTAEQCLMCGQRP